MERERKGRSGTLLPLKNICLHPMLNIDSPHCSYHFVLILNIFIHHINDV